VSAPTDSAAQFATTHWSVVLSAGNHSSHAREALGQLCQTYWQPLYAFVRRKGYSPHDAQDLTQSFLLRLLAREDVRKADPDCGRFRSFLLTSLQNFLRDEWSKESAQKRGGGQVHYDLDDAEASYQRELRNDLTPDRLFERRWATTVLNTVLARLQQEFVSAGKGRLYELLQPLLLGEKPSATYAQFGLQLGMTEGAVRIAAHRMQNQYRDLLRAEIAQTISNPADLDDEIRHLASVLM
jgi:RNA polymerase sigma-70 factor (ECF subfamily)